MTDPESVTAFELPPRSTIGITALHLLVESRTAKATNVPDVPFDQSALGLWASLPLIWLALSVVYRRRVGKPLFARPQPGATFVERWASARCGTGMVARLASARNCMHVQVTPTELRLHPHFPFTLGFMPELYDLDHVVPLICVQSAIVLDGNAAKAIELKYLGSSGDERELLLLLRNGDAFIRAVLDRNGGA